MKSTEMKNMTGSGQMAYGGATVRNVAPITTLGSGVAGNDPVWPSTYELYQAARANRAYVLGEMVATASRSVRAFVRRTYRRYRKYRQQSALYETLSQLDDRTLHDLGFDRSEIRSVAAEWAGEAERTRVRVMHAAPESSSAGQARHFARAAEAAAAE